MKLYLVERPGDEVGYDEYDAHLIRAKNEQEARDMCPYGDEGAEAWQKAKVTAITIKGEEGIIISSFNAG